MFHGRLIGESCRALNKHRVTLAHIANGHLVWHFYQSFTEITKLINNLCRQGAYSRLTMGLWRTLFCSMKVHVLISCFTRFVWKWAQLGNMSRSCQVNHVIKQALYSRFKELSTTADWKWRTQQQQPWLGTTIQNSSNHDRDYHPKQQQHGRDYHPKQQQPWQGLPSKTAATMAGTTIQNYSSQTTIDGYLPLFISSASGEW